MDSDILVTVSCASKLCCQSFGTACCFHVQDWFPLIGNIYV